MLVDGVSMVSAQMWYVLSHIQTQYGVICIGVGECTQLKPIKEETNNCEHRTLVKQLFTGARCGLKTSHRFDDNAILQYVHACANGKRIVMAKYGTEEHEVCLACTNECVNGLIKQWHEHDAQHHSETLTVNGNGTTTSSVHRDLEILAYRTPPGGLYTNTE